MHTKIEVFICYAHEDEVLLRGLEKQLRVLQRHGIISLWHDRNISPGTDWQQEIDTFLNRAHIILLLVSPDFMVSDYCYSIEMQRAMQRHEQGLARVLPIILRPVYWQAAPFRKLQVLPTDAKPVLSSSWHSQDEAFYNVVEGIRDAIEKLSETPQLGSAKKTTPDSQKTLEQLMGEGEVFCAQEQYEEALIAFDQATQIDLNYAPAYGWKGDTLYQQKRYEEALKAYDQAIQVDPSYWYAHIKKGEALYELERYQEALTAFDQTIQIDPNYALAYGWKGAALYMLERYEEALKARDQSIRGGNASKESYTGKGEALYQLKRYEEAITAFDQAIQIDPSYRNAYSGKAKVISALKKLK